MKRKIVALALTAILILVGILVATHYNNADIDTDTELVLDAEVEQEVSEPADNAGEIKADYDICATPQSATEHDSEDQFEYNDADVSDTDYIDESISLDQDVENIDTTAEKVLGSVLINGIDASLLFAEPFLDTLGLPLNYPTHEHAWNFNYDGFVVMSAAGINETADQIGIWPPNIHVLEVEGIALNNDMTRTELITLLGEPFEYSTGEIRYRIANPSRYLILDILFYFPFDESATILGISIWG
jgi:hypothetical protein